MIIDAWKMTSEYDSTEVYSRGFNADLDEAKDLARRWYIVANESMYDQYAWVTRSVEGPDAQTWELWKYRAGGQWKDTTVRISPVKVRITLVPEEEEVRT